MPNLAFIAEFSEVYRMETTDPVLAGPNGIFNTVISQLGNRTLFLKNLLDNGGLANAINYSGDMLSMTTPGFYIIKSGATNKPFTAGNGIALCIKGTGISGAIPLFFGHIVVDDTGSMYVRIYNNNGPITDWIKQMNQADFDTFQNSFIGAVQSFAMSSVPSGWLSCNGAAVSRVTYQNLFNKIGETYGAGDGVSTFNVPDMRGEFVRGWDDGRGVDSGRLLGSAQDHQLQDHEHSTNSSPRQEVTNQDGIGTIPGAGAGGTSTGGIESGEGNSGNETRPRNIALMYCIKY